MEIEKQNHWHSRGYLPHYDCSETYQSLTFRLADSLPQKILTDLGVELKSCAPQFIDMQRRKLIEGYLDAGMGCCALKNSQVGAVVKESLTRFDGERYQLIAWCIMPNHVHVLIKPKVCLSKIIQSWKSYSGKWALQHNEALCLGIPKDAKRFWMREYWDRFIRDENHFYKVIHYIHENPVKAGLCVNAYEWQWSSAAGRAKH